MAWKGPLIYFSGGDGLCVLDSATAETHAISLDAYEPFEEAVFLQRLGLCLFADPDSGTVRVVTATATGLEQKSAVLSVRGALSDLQGDGARIMAVAEDSCGKVAWSHLLHQTDVGYEFESLDLGRLPEDAIPIGMVGSRLLAKYDRTPFEPRYVLLGQDGTEEQSWTTHALARDDEVAIWADAERGGFGLARLSEVVRRREALGYVSSLVGYGGQWFGLLYREGGELLVSIDDDLNCRVIDASSGKKQLFETSDGIALLRRDLFNGLRLELLDEQGETVAETSLGEWKPLNADRIWRRSPRGAEAVIAVDPGQNPAGTIVHLHGGPDSYEVEELRFFAALRDAVEHGVRLVSLNYRGSTGVDDQARRDAWQAWDRSFPEDIDWLTELDVLQGPVVWAGWSFGGALALIAAALRPEPAVALIGGALADLRSHRLRAAEESPAYEEWFSLRFGSLAPPHPATSFFDLVRLNLSRVRVLSFHGCEDPHCAYSDLKRLAAPYLEHGSWRHYDLPGKAHYATSIEDAELIHSKSVEFLAAAFRLEKAVAAEPAAAASLPPEESHSRG